MDIPAIPARVFQPPPVTCPGCHGTLRGPTEECELCHWTAWHCVERFPWQPPVLERILDVDSRLSPDEAAAINRAVDTLEAAMPQLTFHLCIAKLPEKTDVRECGFWMLNAGLPRNETDLERRPWSILLLIDRVSRSASLTVGYALDLFVSDRRLMAALTPAAGHFQRGEYGAGVSSTISRLQRELATCQREATYLAEKFRHSVEDGSVSPELLRECQTVARRTEY